MAERHLEVGLPCLSIMTVQARHDCVELAHRLSGAYIVMAYVVTALYSYGLLTVSAGRCTRRVPELLPAFVFVDVCAMTKYVATTPRSQQQMLLSTRHQATEFVAASVAVSTF